MHDRLIAWVAGLLGTVCQSALKQIWQLNITGMTVSTLKCISSDLLAYYNAVGAVHSICRVKWVCTDYDHRGTEGVSGVQ